ncbi:MAG: putative Ig domain-containing protein [Candidatus Didemnitutus sp.]|nr:putative Ig domain-containing protein [Candidatus Didemnitutus sp.]
MISLSARFGALRLLGLALLCVGFATAARAVDLVLAAGQAGVAYTPYTIVTDPPAANGTVYSATGLPSGMSINASTGTISGTPLVDGVFTGTISLDDAGTINNFTYSLTIDAALGVSQVSSELTALGAVGQDFSYLITATNSPQSYNVGTLPAGLTYSAGAISGQPTTAGTYNVSLSANNATGTGPSVTLVITVEPSGPVPTISGQSSVTADLNIALNYQITASNSPTSYGASGLPVGLSVDTSTGAITGTPTVGGIFTATLTASNGNGASAAFPLTFVLGPVAVVNSATTLTGYSSIAITPYQLTATNSPTAFNVGTLPAGLSYNSTTKQITGTPAAAGTTSVTIYANNAIGRGPDFTLSVQITASATPQITAQPVGATKNYGESVTFSVTATGTPTPTYQWKKGASDIPLATSASYTIPSVTLNDAADYTVVVTNGAGSVTSDVATLTVNSGYAAWRAAKFTGGEVADDAISGTAADPDGDGLTNLLEYALDLAPKAVSSSGLPAVAKTATDWTFTYSRPADRPDISYTVQYSTNLSTWSSAGTHTRTATGATETWQASVPLGTGSAVFFRLKIDYPAAP